MVLAVTTSTILAVIFYFNYFQGHETSVISQFRFFRRNRQQQHRTRAADIFVFIDYARTKPLRLVVRLTRLQYRSRPRLALGRRHAYWLSTLVRLHSIFSVHVRSAYIMSSSSVRLSACRLPLCNIRAPHSDD